MSYLTLAGEMEKAVLLDAMLCATKVYNGLIWELRQEYEQIGKSRVSRQNLNRILKELPRAQGYYSLSVRATRDEVIGAYRSYFELRRNGNQEARPPGFRRSSSRHRGASAPVSFGKARRRARGLACQSTARSRT